jgi:bifunctional DNA-binding transcriptional regulator/antitoxin component of YhaV-PrlF toxin-antitoxin module
MAAYTTRVQKRGVTVVPADLRRAADVGPGTELTWVEVGPRLWLVGPREEHPGAGAPAVAAALRSEAAGLGPFPKIMRRILAGDIPQRVSRGRHRMRGAQLAEAQMIALGTPAIGPERRRGGR